MQEAASLRKESGLNASDRQFFKNLPCALTFDEALQGDLDRCLPSDWWVVVTDVVHSTEAIQRGLYKDVNAVGAAVIIAAINLDRSVEIPYVFGGDGATLAIPPDLETAMRKALLATQQLARDAFDLELRAAMVPVYALEESGTSTRVVKYRQSTHMQLAIFTGDGWALAETWAKTRDQLCPYDVRHRSDLVPTASYDGFECRWKNVSSRRDHKLCLMVASVHKPAGDDRDALNKVLDILHEIYGDWTDHHPITVQSLSLGLNPFRLVNEAKIRLAHRDAASLLTYIARTLMVTVLGKILFHFKVKTSSVDWGAYKPDFIANADFYKFDGCLKMILDSTEQETQRLEASLEHLYQAGEIVYGTHRSPHAILTCLVFSYAGHHAHFVDGSDGGYALASIELKKRWLSTLDR